MLRRRLAVTSLMVLATLATLGSFSPAEAAKRKVPFGFFGTVLNNSQIDRISDATLDAQMASMAKSGVESVRYTLSWADIERAPGAHDFRATDRFVAAAARHHLDVLPIVMHTPRWASTQPASGYFSIYAPVRPELYGNFARALVERYGPKGSFWSVSGTPRVPIRNWQVWDEPAASFFWATRPWPQSYTPLLKAAYRAIHGADRRAKVVLASLAGVTSSTPWAQLRQLYKTGAKRYFDAVSVHFFSAAPSVRLTIKQTLQIAGLVRREMRRAKDRRGRASGSPS